MNKLDRVPTQHTRSEPCLSLLVVDPERDFTQRFHENLAEIERYCVKHVTTVSLARQWLNDHAVDIVVTREKLPDASGLALASELSKRERPVHTVLLSDHPSLELVVSAMRSGVDDIALDPSDLDDVKHRVRSVYELGQRDKRQFEKLRRIRRTCRKLSQSRAKVTHQVDALCNDLVNAYQELSQQVQQVMYTSAYDAVMQDELDFEQLLRRTLEFIVEKVGACNAAIFLPGSHDEFSVAGFVQHDVPQAGLHLLLDELADVLAPRISEYSDVVAATDAASREQWLGEAASFFEGRQVVTFACCDQDETLAVITLFRSEEQPFDESATECGVALAPMIGERLARVIRVHHRTGYDCCDN